MNPRSAAGAFALFLATLLLAACAGTGTAPLQLISGGGVEYPAEAQASGVEGYVDVRYDLDAEGRVENATVIAAEPEGVFEQAALAAVSGWRFRVPLRNGAPQPVTGLQSRVAFQIGSDQYDRY